MWIPQQIYIIIYHKFYKEKKSKGKERKRAGRNKQEIKKTKTEGNC